MPDHSVLYIRVPVDVHNRLVRLAKAAGKSLAEFYREKLHEAAERELAEATRRLSENPDYLEGS